LPILCEVTACISRPCDEIKNHFLLGRIGKRLFSWCPRAFRFDAPTPHRWAYSTCQSFPAPAKKCVWFSCPTGPRAGHQIRGGGWHTNAHWATYNGASTWPKTPQALPGPSPGRSAPEPFPGAESCWPQKSLEKRRLSRTPPPPPRADVHPTAASGDFSGLHRPFLPILEGQSEVFLSSKPPIAPTLKPRAAAHRPFQKLKSSLGPAGPKKINAWINAAVKKPGQSFLSTRLPSDPSRFNTAKIKSLRLKLGNADLFLLR